jgi:hypothetical protein
MVCMAMVSIRRGGASRCQARAAVVGWRCCQAGPVLHAARALSSQPAAAHHSELAAALCTYPLRSSACPLAPASCCALPGTLTASTATPATSPACASRASSTPASSARPPARSCWISGTPGSGRWRRAGPRRSRWALSCTRGRWVSAAAAGLHAVTRERCLQGVSCAATIYGWALWSWGTLLQPSVHVLYHLHHVLYHLHHAPWSPQARARWADTDCCPACCATQPRCPTPPVPA